MADITSTEIEMPLEPTSSEKRNEQATTHRNLAKKTFLRREQQIQELKEENVRDPLTGAYNRGYLDRQLEERLTNGNHNFSVVMLDIDHFKDFNDTYGHKEGDAVLIELIRILNNNLRIARPNGARDFISRYGGEEFTIILSGVDNIEVAETVAEKLRQEIENSPAKIKQENKIISVGRTVSMGVAVGRESDTSESIIKRADAALYSAKESGRNKVMAEKEIEKAPVSVSEKEN